MPDHQVGFPQVNFLIDDEKSSLELSKYGYFDQFGHFREKKNGQQLETDFSIRFTKSKVTKIKNPQIDIYNYRFNPHFLPVLSQQERLNKYLLSGEAERIQQIRNTLYGKDDVYFCFIGHNNTDLIKAHGTNYINNFLAYSDVEKDIVRNRLKTYSEIFNIHFKECELKDLRQNTIKSKCRPYLFVKGEMDNSVIGGWLSFDAKKYTYTFLVLPTAFDLPPEQVNTYLKFVFLHEIGHLFLEHSFLDSENVIDPTTMELVKRWDHLGNSTLYSMQSYTPHVIEKNMFLNPYDKTLCSTVMHDDILAISKYLKLNPNYQSGATNYVVPKGDIKVSTITDRNGKDNLDFSQHEYSWIDLSKEGFSSGDVLPFQRGVGPFTDLENAHGASQFAFIQGNTLDNDVKAQVNGVFMTGSGNDIHREGTGKNIHFIALGTGQDRIISQGGQTNIHLFHYAKDEMIVVDKDKELHLVHTSTGDQITYEKSSSHDANKVNITIENKTYKVSDFASRDTFNKNERPLVESTKSVVKPNQEILLSDVVTNLKADDQITICDTNASDTSSYLYDVRKKQTIPINKPYTAKVGDIKIYTAKGLKNEVDKITLTSPSKKHGSVLTLYTSQIQPEIKAKKYFVKNGSSYPLGDILSVDHAGLKPSAFTIKGRGLNSFDFSVTMGAEKDFTKGKDTITFKEKDLSKMTLASKTTQGANLGEFEIYYHYADGAKSNPFSFGVMSRDNIAPLTIPLENSYVGSKSYDTTINFDYFKNKEAYFDADDDPLTKAEIIFDHLPKGVDLKFKGNTIKVGQKITLENQNQKIALLSVAPNKKLEFRARFYDGHNWSRFGEIAEIYSP